MSLQTGEWGGDQNWSSGVHQRSPDWAGGLGELPESLQRMTSGGHLEVSKVIQYAIVPSDQSWRLSEE